jgi:hypothetical protein
MKLYKIHFMNPSIMNESCSVSFGWKGVPLKMSLPPTFSSLCLSAELHVRVHHN